MREFTGPIEANQDSSLRDIEAKVELSLIDGIAGEVYDKQLPIANPPMQATQK